MEGDLLFRPKLVAHIAGSRENQECTGSVRSKLGRLSHPYCKHQLIMETE